DFHVTGVQTCALPISHTRYLNGDVLFPYTQLAHAVKMTPANYDPRRATPLFDQSVVLLGTVVAKAQELAQAGIAVRTVTLIITRSEERRVGKECRSRW